MTALDSDAVVQRVVTQPNSFDIGDIEYWMIKKVFPANTLQAKIVLSGEVKTAFTVSGVGVTKGAREAIEKAGGKAILIEVPKSATAAE